ncbi:heat-inducible transcriptional repressor HrcA [Haploplasma axanthum]|uniref:Heat-inducible transcription repressor HrcA n=1 Tax=Haploplasma axanthum TaxID=29552 RepID=A0A449BEM4_HAPAX|nr:heat-inducible transcriptional repressor HrcA [Haploplasma axanthum]VEU80901.1 heat inducible transcription repressor HrcA [Haploplasma axanthum]
MLTSRQKLILKAIIEQYVEDAQPVGSKLLTEMPYLNYSSATIRYDMARLEELGYLEKTHTSSGRIPSQKGYRYYVNNLVTRDSDVIDDFPLVDEILTKHSYSRKLAVEEAINLLSDLTKYTALAVGPANLGVKIKKIDFIPVANNEAVILIVTDHGHVQHQNINIPDGMKIDDLKEVIKTLDELLHNRQLDEASEILKNEFAKTQISSFMEYQNQLFESFINAFSKFAEDNFYLSGITNVFDQPEFTNINHVKNFVNMLDRREIVKLIGGNDGLTVTFGSEIELKTMENFSIISIPYSINEQEKGTIAVLGPTRMEYSKVIPLLEYIASNLGKLYRK